MNVIEYHALALHARSVALLATYRELLRRIQNAIT